MPAGRRQRSQKARAAVEPRFVIQKHDASTLHYDFRLEVDGVLKSWAVPKGPSPDPRQKRLAMAVEDHPLEYGSFEGVIPAGQYGGGAVIVWDTGTYRNLTERQRRSVPMSQALKQGHAVVELHGRKLHGAYAITRTSRPDERRERWILVKRRDAQAEQDRDPVATSPESVLSGKTVEQIARHGGKRHGEQP